MHSPVEVRKDMADRIDNQIDVFGKTFLGMTMACARCHDHKFDAVPTKDYYAMMGYLESSRYQRAFIDNPKPTRDLIDRLHEVRRELDPIAIMVTSCSLLSRIQKGGDPAKADAVIRPLLELAATNESHFAAKKNELLERWKAEKERATGFEGQATSFESFTKSSYKDWFVTGEAFGEKPAHFGQIELRPDDLMPVRRVCRDGLAYSGQVSGRLQGALRSKTFRLEKSHILYHLAGQGVRVNLIIDGYQRIQAPIYGGLTFYAQNDRLYWAEQDVSMWKGHNAYIEFLDDGDGCVAVDRIVFADNAVPAEAPNPLLARLLEDLSVDTPTKLKEKIQGLFREIIDQWQSGKLTMLDDRNERIDLLNALLSSEWTKEAAGDSQDQVDRDRLKSSLTRWQDIEKQIPTPRRVMAMTDGTGINERIFIRGNYKSLGEEAPRRFLQVLAGSDQAAPGSGSGRLELARRMVDPSNPLLSRVMVNRIWKHHFGEGIVRTPDDFGVQGQVPTHPELLDYLAGEFIRQGWSIKKMHRMMVLSSTYCMASHASAKDEEADPQNKLLHRMPIRRLEAECIRDAILAVSGRLDVKIYGPSVPPYLTDFMLGRGRPASGPLDGDGRRSLYIKVRRNFLTPMFLAFDYPIPFTTMGRRSVSNVPAQALALMNNPFVIQQAGLWANRILSEKSLTPTQRIKGMYRSAYSREPSEVEIADALGFVDEQAKEYGKKDDPRAWTDLCHVMMNAKEFIFIN
jgi:hypothetical protein